MVTAAEGGAPQVLVDFGEGFSEADSIRLEVTTEPQLIRMPPGSDAEGWSVRLDPLDAQATSVCLVEVG